MEDRKGRVTAPEPPPTSERRRMSKIVHDHKGTASVEWRDAPEDHERPILEIEGARQAPRSLKGTLNTGGLAIAVEDSHDPYTRVPVGDRGGPPGRPRDLRKLSAWIKLMRELEEAKKHRDDE